MILFTFDHYILIKNIVNTYFTLRYIIATNQIFHLSEKVNTCICCFFNAYNIHEKHCTKTM